MKISNKILLGLFAAIALNALTGMVMVRSSLSPQGIGNGPTYLEGAGNNKKVRLTTGNFSEVYMDGDYQVNLIQGAEEYLEIEAQENIVDLFELEKDDGKTISINVKADYTLAPTNQIIITIGFKDLEVINAYGHSRFFSEQTLKFEDLFIGLNGASYIQTPLTANNLRMQFSGATNGQLTGTATNLNVTLSGGSNLHAKELTTSNTHASVNGASYVAINVKEYLNAVTSGAGTIEYYGDPKKVDQQSSGASGSYKK